MQKSHSSALTKIALLVLIASVSGSYGYDYYDKVAVAQAEQAIATGELQKAERSIQELRSLLKGRPGGRVDAQTQLDAFIYSAWESLDSLDMRAEVAVKSSRGTQGPQALSSYWTTIPDTSIKVAKVSITGNYGTYQDFKALLGRLEQGGGFLVGMKVRDKAFELNYQVYGS